jgi:purine catabolism regulator
MISVDALLKAPELKELKVIAGHRGLGKKIRAVTVIDAPDSYKWLRGYELILTSGYLVGGDPGLLEHFIVNLAEAGASGLGIKKDRFVKTIPEHVVNTADKMDFPLIELPYHFVWSDMFSVYYELLHLEPEKQPAAIEPECIEQIYNAARWGSHYLLDTLTQLFNLPVAVILNNKQIKADNGISGAVLIADALESSLLFPENMGNEILTVGKYFIAVCPIPFNRAGSVEYIAIMSQSGAFLKELKRVFLLLASLGDHNKLDANDREKIYREFILSFISGKITETDAQRFETFRGAGQEVYTGVMIIESDDSMATYIHAADILKKARLTNRGKAVSHIVNNAAKHETIVMLELHMTNPAETPEIWQHIFIEDMEYLVQDTKDCFVSMGRLYKNLSDISTSYHEAREACIIGRILWEERKCFLYSMVSFYNILRKADPSQLDFGFIQLLEDNKAGFSFDGIKTLEAFIERGGYKKAAADLFIHENTLRYRVQKIGELLHIDLEDPVVIHSLLTQVKLWKLLNPASVK